MFFLVVVHMSLLDTNTTVPPFKHWLTQHRSRWPAIHRRVRDTQNGHSVAPNHLRYQVRLRLSVWSWRDKFA